MSIVTGICPSFFFTDPQSISSAASRVSIFAKVFFKKLKEISYFCFKSLFGTSSQLFIHGSSVLWDWKWQAIYLRSEVWIQKVSHYIDKFSFLKKEKDLQTMLQRQKERIAKLDQELLMARKEVSELRQDLVTGYKFQIDTAAENKGLKQALEEEKLSSSRLKMQQDILTKEEELRALFLKINTRYEESLISKSDLIPFSHQHLISSLIPAWQKHLETLCDSMDELISGYGDSHHKELMMGVVELAKRPLLFTQFLAKFCHTLSPKVPHLQDSSSLLPKEEEDIDFITIDT
jgi:hypothetical protein